MNLQHKLLGRSITTSKGQTTIPKPVRDALGIKDGTPLTWILEDGAIRVVAKTLNAADLAGILGPPPNGARLSVEEMDDAIGEAVAERFARATRR